LRLRPSEAKYFEKFEVLVDVPAKQKYSQEFEVEVQSQRRTEGSLENKS